jgi:hypothetical protein
VPLYKSVAGPPATHFVSGASAAATPAADDIEPRVGFVEGVPGLAMGLGGVSRRHASSAQDVYPGSNWLKMGGVDASAVPAQVVDGEPFGDRADGHFVSPAVRRRAYRITKAPVPVFVTIAGPVPTGTGYLNLAPEPTLDGGFRAAAGKHNVRASLPSPPGVVRAAPPPPDGKFRASADGTSRLHGGSAFRVVVIETATPLSHKQGV